jgi:hypothetical protein
MTRCFVAATFAYMPRRKASTTKAQVKMEAADLSLDMGTSMQPLSASPNPRLVPHHRLAKTLDSRVMLQQRPPDPHQYMSNHDISLCLCIRRSPKTRASRKPTTTPSDSPPRKKRPNYHKLCEEKRHDKFGKQRNLSSRCPRRTGAPSASRTPSSRPRSVSTR